MSVQHTTTTDPLFQSTLTTYQVHVLW